MGGLQRKSRAIARLPIQEGSGKLWFWGEKGAAEAGVKPMNMRLVIDDCVRNCICCQAMLWKSRPWGSKSRYAPYAALVN
jgi:hypothetical protein